MESRQKSQDLKDIQHLVALQSSGQFQGIRVAHVRGSDDPLLWIPDVVLGAFNATHKGNFEYWEALRDKLVWEYKVSGSR